MSSVSITGSTRLGLQAQHERRSSHVSVYVRRPPSSTERPCDTWPKGRDSPGMHIKAYLLALERQLLEVPFCRRKLGRSHHIPVAAVTIVRSLKCVQSTFFSFSKKCFKLALKILLCGRSLVLLVSFSPSHYVFLFHPPRLLQCR